MLSTINKVVGGSHLVLMRRLLLSNRLTSQFSLFKKISEDSEQQRKSSRAPMGNQQFLKGDRFKRRTPEDDQRNEKWASSLSQQLQIVKEEHHQNVEKINKINTFFLGIKHNTKYKKYYKEAIFSNIDKEKKIYRIDDLPFNFQEKATLDEHRISRRVNCKRQQYLFNNVSEDKLKSRMYNMAKGFFSDIIKGERTVHVEPNFELFSHSVIRSLQASSYEFQFVEESESKDPVFIKDIYFMKGVKAIRNENYSVDSYKVDMERFEDQKLIEYSLWKNEGERYPEPEWEAMKNVTVRFETAIKLPFIIDILHPSRALPNIGLQQHDIVFQMNLVLPPPFAQFRLSEEEYTRSYRVNLNNLTITNIDGKNPFYAMSFKESEKENLINKLV